MPETKDVETFEARGLKFHLSDQQLTATLPNRKKVRLTLLLDLEQLFQLMEGVGSISEDGDVIATLSALRTIMPEEFLAAVKGVDAAVSLTIFMEWARILGERLGKALI